jgi:hypothetical protein
MYYITHNQNKYMKKAQVSYDLSYVICEIVSMKKAQVSYGLSYVICEIVSMKKAQVSYDHMLYARSFLYYITHNQNIYMKKAQVSYEDVERKKKKKKKKK